MKVLLMKLVTWLKWISTTAIIIGAILTSLDIRPMNIIIFNFGNISWVIVGCIWREWSIVVLNVAVILIYMFGILTQYHLL